MQKLSLTKKYASYPEYKDSEVEWLGAVPENWKLERLKYVAPLYSKKVPGKNEFGTYVALENVESWSGRHIPSQNVVEPESLVNIFENKDILFGKLRPYLAKVFQPNFNGTATGEFLVLRPTKKISRKYLFYRLLSQEFINAVNDSTYGSQMPRASWSFIGNLPVTIPNFSEQEKIAKFLDQKTTRIDELIVKKQKQIELLKEEIVSIAQNEQMNGKGENIRMRDLFKLADRPIELEEYSEYVALGLYNRGRGLFIKNPQLGKDIKESDFYRVIPRDLIISGQFAWEGAVALASKDESKCVVSHRYYLLRDGVVKTEYLLALLMTKFGDHILNESSRGSAGRNRPLNIKILLKEKIRVPSKETEAKIELLLIRMSLVRGNIKKSIKLLEEYKSSLISHAVTGKIKV
ncbi:restriction endonuclease subunit S [Candidatus Pacebacteria bacterium]|nr:restriction endonuclease subunit S [Candidatus Paceibacterota bacterium]